MTPLKQVSNLSINSLVDWSYWSINDYLMSSNLFSSEPKELCPHDMDAQVMWLNDGSWLLPLPLWTPAPPPKKPAVVFKLGQRTVWWVLVSDRPVPLWWSGRWRQLSAGPSACWAPWAGSTGRHCWRGWWNAPGLGYPPCSRASRSCGSPETKWSRRPSLLFE